MRIIVHNAKCQGHARCWAQAPDIFELDDEGYILPGDINVAERDELLASRGARSCPERALEIGRTSDALLDRLCSIKTVGVKIERHRHMTALAFVQTPYSFSCPSDVTSTAAVSHRCASGEAGFANSATALTQSKSLLRDWMRETPLPISDLRQSHETQKN